MDFLPDGTQEDVQKEPSALDILNKVVCVKLEIDQDIEVWGYFDPFMDPEVIKSARRLRQAGTNARSQKKALEEMDAERDRYFKKHCRRIELRQVGEDPVNLSEGDDWHEKIYPFWRYNMVAYFGDRAALSVSDRGN